MPVKSAENRKQQGMQAFYCRMPGQGLMKHKSMKCLLVLNYKTIEVKIQYQCGFWIIYKPFGLLKFKLFVLHI